MIKRLLVIVTWSLVIASTMYLSFPLPKFPQPPNESLQSGEPADMESIYRRAYFVNLTRQQVLDHYQDQYGGLINYRLNYPPEEAYALVRDQTRSSYLEEIVLPWRGSLFVNGFVPTKPTEQINRNGVHYLAKVTVRFAPSHFVVRLTTLGMTALIGYFLVKEYVDEIRFA